MQSVFEIIILYVNVSGCTEFLRALAAQMTMRKTETIRIEVKQNENSIKQFDLRTLSTKIRLKYTSSSTLTASHKSLSSVEREAECEGIERDEREKETSTTKYTIISTIKFAIVFFRVLKHAHRHTETASDKEENYFHRMHK